jgi:GntR family transcriptional regulator/MocR family aminotransferase
MPVERREALLSQADRHDFLIIEDDYECGINGCASAMPALKGLDRGDRVIYVGSLSKTLAPGLRLGFIVGDAALIREARALRRLMLRHPPANNQRAAALFLALGHHAAYLRRLTHILAERSAIASRALGRHLPQFTCRGDAAGSSFWIEGPSSLDARHLAEEARGSGVLIEPGDVFFGCTVPPRNVFRLGVSSIPTERIEPGIAKLANVLGSLGQ